MGRRDLRRHFWGNDVCLCPIKGTPGLNELSNLSDVIQSYDFALYTQSKDCALYMPKCGENMFESIERSFLQVSFKHGSIPENKRVPTSFTQLYLFSLNFNGTSLAYHVVCNRRSCLRLFSEF